MAGCDKNLTNIASLLNGRNARAKCEYFTEFLFTF